MKQKRSEASRLLRFAADKLCLWCLCGRKGCRRARSCRGDVRACANLVGDWLAAIDASAPNFDMMEAGIETPEELRTYRAWRRALECARESSAEDPAETERMREALRRQIEALRRTALSAQVGQRPVAQASDRAP